MGKTTDKRRVVISNELKAQLEHLQEKTGATPKALMKQLRDTETPQGLTHAIIQGWLDGRLTTAKQDYINFVLEKWPTFKGSPDWPDQSPHQFQCVDLDNETISILRYHRKRTGVGPAGLLRIGREDTPEGLKPATIVHWLHGNVKTVRKEHLEYVLNRWAALEDLSLRKINDLAIMSARRSNYVILTTPMLKALRDLRDLTGVGATNLLRRDSNSPVKPSTVDCWLTGKTTSVNFDHYEYVLNKWKWYARQQGRLEWDE